MPPNRTAIQAQTAVVRKTYTLEAGRSPIKPAHWHYVKGTGVRRTCVPPGVGYGLESLDLAVRVHDGDLDVEVLEVDPKHDRVQLVHVVATEPTVS